MEKLLKSALVYLTYPSTWSGLVKMIAAAGIVISPEHIALITSIGLALSGAINTIWSDADTAAAAKAAKKK